jgi:hypothetical protein
MIGEYHDIRDLIEDRHSALGFDRLEPEERTYAMLWAFEAECSNGTLHQFFYNSTGDMAPEILQCLQGIGASRAHAILSSAMAKFGPTYPTDRALRQENLRSMSDGIDAFTELNDRLFRESEDLRDLSLSQVADCYARLNITSVPRKRRIVFRALALMILLILILALIASVAFF